MYGYMFVELGDSTTKNVNWKTTIVLVCILDGILCPSI